MAKTIRSIMLFMIVCFVSLAIALPSVPRPRPRPPPLSNEPRTLLGKPYRRLWRSFPQPDAPPTRWPTLESLITGDDTGNSDSTTSTSSDHVLVQASKDDNDAYADTSTHTHAHTSPDQQLAFPPALILNTPPQSLPASRAFGPGISLDLAGLGTARLRLGLATGSKSAPLRGYKMTSSPLEEGGLLLVASAFDEKNVVVWSKSGECKLGSSAHSASELELGMEQQQQPAAALVIVDMPERGREVEVELRKESVPKQRSKLYDRGQWKSRLSEDY